MYLDHFGLKEPPFRITPHTDFFFSGANRGATLEGLLYAITNDEGIVKVTGEVGSGKTMLCRVLIERLPKNVETIYLANPSLGRDEILYAIADELEIDYSQDRPSRLMRVLLERLITLYAEGRRVVVLIDEAHAMPRETLEEIRLLSNLESSRHKLLQMVLFGQPELDSLLNTTGLRQLMERITQSFRLEPLVRGDIEKYIDFRMRAAGYRGPNLFSANALRLIADASEGLTRRINILADKSLLAAFAAGTHAITVKEARRAIRDSEFYRVRRNWRPLELAVAGLAGGLIIGLGVHFLLLEAPAPQPPVPAVRPPAPAGPVPAAQGRIGMPASVPSETPAPGVVAAAVSPAAAGTAPVPAAAATRPAAAANVEAPAHRRAAERTTPGSSTGAGVASPDAPVGPLPPARAKAAGERFLVTQEWLQSAPAHHYSIQLITAKDSELAQLEGFLLRGFNLAAREKFHVYSVKIDGVQCYRAAYGLYPNLAETLAAMRELPAALLVYRPYYRTVERMRSQNRQ